MLFETKKKSVFGQKPLKPIQRRESAEDEAQESHTPGAMASFTPSSTAVQKQKTRKKMKSVFVT